MKMTAEQQRIAIAEACGTMKWGYGLPTKCIAFNVPDYLNDLNAMHEAVKTLPQNLMPRYFACLCNVVSGSLSLYGYSKATEATAAQRAEAFLKTIGKWVTE